MIQELISTSAPRCLNGNAGFGIVAQTEGMAPNVSLAVNALSGYTHVAPAGSTKNPVVYLHAVRRTGGMLRHIVSRIADCGNDYSGRTNRIAHHWIIEEEDVRNLPGGPAVLSAQNIFRQDWNEKPTTIPPQRISVPAVQPKKCVVWEQLTSDAGRGGQVAEHAEKGNPISIIFSSEHKGDLLRDLIGESLALLPRHVRWNITFSTYFLKSQETNQESIQIKCFLAGSEESRFARQSPNTLVIDLRQRADRVPQGKYVDMARGAVKPAAMAPLESHESVSAAVPIAVPVQSETYGLDDANSKVRRGSFRGIYYGRSGKISQSTRSSPDWRQIALLLLLLVVCAMIIGFAVIRITADRTETAKNAEDLQEKQPVADIQPTNNTTQEKPEAVPEPKTTNGTQTTVSSKSEAAAEKEEPAETPADNANAAQTQSSEVENNDRNPPASPTPISPEKWDELKKELPPLWKGLALSVKPNAEESLLLKTKILYECRDNVTLKLDSFVNLQEPVGGQQKLIVVEEKAHEITFRFKYADVKSANITGGEKPGEEIAKISLTEEGLQFQWTGTPPNDLNSKLFINRILLSQLQILIDQKPIAEIALWEPYNPDLLSSNPGVLYDNDSKFYEELFFQFEQNEKTETKYEILFYRTNNPLQKIDERFYLLHPDGSGKKLLLMEKPAVKNYNKL